MPRLKYYNYFADVIKYDLGFSIQHCNQYNDDIRNPSRRTDPNNLNYDLSIDDIDFSINSLHDRLLISVDEQIYLHLSPAETARSKKSYDDNLLWIKKQFPKMSFVSTIRNQRQYNAIKY